VKKLVLILILLGISWGCASNSVSPSVGVGVGTGWGGVGVNVGGGQRQYQELNSSYKNFLGKLNPNDENSISNALDYYRQNFSRQDSFESINDEGFRDFRRFYEDAVLRIVARVEAAPQDHQKLIEKLPRYGLELQKDGEKSVVRKTPGFLEEKFKDYVSPKMAEQLKTDTGVATAGPSR
jgi:hypothetical protein